MSTARDEILQRIRAALPDIPAGERPDDVPVERGYLHEDPAPREVIVERFAERVAEYRATVRRVERFGLPDAIAGACAARGVRRLVTPADLPADWLTDGGLEGVELLRDSAERQLSNTELEACDGALTGCALGIAQTGTIVLDCGPTQGRRAITLLPDYHLCVVREDQVVGLVPEAIARLGELLRAERRPLTFISGPSATSDIELNRVEGVHGPRMLEVIIMDDG